MSTTTTPYPTITPADRVVYLNSTSLKKLSCPRAFQLHNTQGFKLIKESESLTIGKCLHLFAETFDREKGSVVKALEAATSAYPDVPTGDIIKWGSGRKGVSLPTVAIANDGAPLLEHYFEVPYVRYTNNETGESYVVVLCGTIDRLSILNGVVYMHDYKSSRKYKIADIEAQYMYDAQQRFYLWNLIVHGDRFLPAAMAAATAAHRVASRIVAIQVGSVQNPKWHQCPEILMNADEVAEFGRGIDVACEYAVEIAAAVEIAGPLGKATGACGGANNYTCDFAPLCFARTADEMSRAQGLYYKTVYTPKHHNI